MMPLLVESSRSMKRGREIMAARGKDLRKLDAVIERLTNREALEPMMHDHPLRGEWSGYRGCHIDPDWVLIYKVIEERLVLYLSRTGTHSDLYKK